MTLIKSIMLGTAAGLVVVSGAAQAADLPTRKAAPVQDYVKVCNVAGMAGFIIPGSDTCLKISGFVLAIYSAGNLKTQYLPNAAGNGYAAINNRNADDSIDMAARSALSIDTAMNTAYGPLVTSFQFRGNTSSANSGIGGATGGGLGNNSNPTGGNNFAIDHGYIQWAGITAGFKGSFFDVLGEGSLWDDYYSPDNLNHNPVVLAYTATFGGGFSATISLESTEAARADKTTDPTFFDVYHGAQYPDVIGVLDFKQGWGEVYIAGAAHNTDVLAGGTVLDLLGLNEGRNTWGWAVNTGVRFNLPSFGVGDRFEIQGDYADGALGYSGASAGNVLRSGNGTLFNYTDQFAYNTPLGNIAWARPKAWSIGSDFTHHFSPVFGGSIEGAYLDVDYGSGPANISTKLTSWQLGAIAHWYPLASSALDFHVELMYTDTHESTPLNWNTVAAPQPGLPFARALAINPVAFQSNSNGFIARIGVERDF
jgi:Porin subfamily